MNSAQGVPGGGDRGARVRLLAIYPVKGEPARVLDVADARTEGLAGDRRKKSPVHIVGEGQTPETTRANVFVDVPEETLRAMLGASVHLGEAVLSIDRLPSGCPGVYASVAIPGRIATGDLLIRKEAGPKVG